MFIIILSALCMLWLCSCSHENSTPQSKQNTAAALEVYHYSSQRGNYSVDIPRIFSSLREDSSIIRIDNHLSARSFTTMAETKNMALIVSAVHYPEARFSLNSSQELLEQTGGEFLRSLRAYSIRYSPDGASGVDIYYKIQDSTIVYHGHTRLSVRRPTVYNSTLITPDSTLFFQKENVHFFTSLQPLH